jgi:hypothetical protein
VYEDDGRDVTWGVLLAAAVDDDDDSGNICSRDVGTVTGGVVLVRKGGKMVSIPSPSFLFFWFSSRVSNDPARRIQWNRGFLTDGMFGR